MIHKVKISNFKSINELELELGRVNVLIGENGCGKTNILEGIASGGVMAEIGDMNDILLSARGVRLTEPHLMKSMFIAKNQVTIKIEFTDDKSNKYAVSHSNYAQDRTKSKKRDNDDKDEILIINFDKKKLQNFIIFCPENYFLRRFEEEGQIKPLGIRGEGLFKHLLKLRREHPEIIQKMNKKLRLIDWFRGFEIPNDLMFTETRLNIKDKYLEDLEYFDQRSVNEGFLYLLFYFTLFMSPYTPSFFAIDNIDTALNPKLAARLLKELTELAKENNKQVLLTTHNPGLLDGINLKSETQKLFTVYRNIDGETYARAVPPLREVKGVEMVRLSEAFIRGYLGGIPSNF